jgi:hypothetical protein
VTANAPVETAHHSTIPGHLGLFSMRVGRKLHGDVRHEKILNDCSASKLPAPVRSGAGRLA